MNQAPVDEQLLFEDLTPRETEVLALLAVGRSDREIASSLFLSTNTVKWYNRQIYGKLGVRTRGQAVRQAQALGLIETSESLPGKPGRNLPTQATTFIGREQELAELGALLDDPNVRLITILAPGGMGKTRLALELATRHAEAFTDGSHFIELAGVDSPEEMVSAIASGIGFHFYVSSDRLEQQLIRFLKRKTMLLLLDNYEHLLPSVDLVTAVLAAAPDVKLVITSRVALNMDWEWRYNIGGMRYPEVAVSGNEYEKYDAFQLFLERASQVRHDFKLRTGGGGVGRIMQLVEGMPLGIELAASWVRTLTPDEIADEISRDLDFLAAERPNAPVRHRSIRALYESIARQLGDSERNAFMALSVFRGGFTREAAEHIAGADVRILAGLCDRALLQQTPGGRYQIHELLRQYGAEQLAETNLADDIHNDHCAYYADFLHQRELGLASHNQLMLRDEVDAEFDNIRAAWRWAVVHREVELLAKALEGLRAFITLKGWWQEGAIAFGQAVEALESSSGLTEQEEIILVQLLARQSHCCEFSGQRDKVHELDEKGRAILRRMGPRPDMPFAIRMLSPYSVEGFQEALAVFEKFGNRWGIASCLLELGHIARASADYAEAQRCYRVSLAMFREEGDRWWMVACLVSLSATLSILGEVSEAGWLEEECLAIASELDSQWNIAQIHYELAVAAWGRCGYEEAEEHARESLAIFREIGYEEGICQALVALGNARYGRRAYPEARRLIGEAIALSWEFSSWSERFCLTPLGFAAFAMGDYQEAERYFRQALEREYNHPMVSAQPFVMLIVGILVGVAAIFAHKGRLEHAVALLSLTSERPSFFKHAEVEAHLIDELEAELPAEVFAAAWERGKGLDVAAVMAELLAEWDGDCCAHNQPQ